MTFSEMKNCLKNGPVIAAVQDNLWNEAVMSPCDIIFYLKANILTVADRIQQAHQAGKFVFVHIDLAEGIGKDRAGITFLKDCGADGIISTKGQLIKAGKEFGLCTIQRFFALDSQGVSGIYDQTNFSRPDMIEIMPGIVEKIIRKLTADGTLVIAGGLVETKEEAMGALNAGAVAVSTGKKDLWTM